MGLYRVAHSEGASAISVKQWVRSLGRTVEKFVAGCQPPKDRSDSATPSRPSTTATEYRPLERVELTDEVSRTLFEEYAEHRQSKRGREEIGWVLMGIRRETDALVLATLPAGQQRSASDVHVQFNSSAQALAARIVRQWNKQLTLVGVVHTHPGTLRHPSDGDLEGDRLWVPQLRGHEGIFTIGTADAKSHEPPGVMWQPKSSVQCMGELRLSWYSLREGDRKYQPLPVELTVGPDYARPLRMVWSAIEHHAERLERLVRQQISVKFEPVMDETGPVLEVTIALAEPKSALRVQLNGEEVRYLLIRDGQALVADLNEPQVDRGVYLLLAELAKSA